MTPKPVALSKRSSFAPALLKPYGLHCEDCSLQSHGHGYVPGRGKKDAPIALLGEAPGWDEVRLGQPFVGAAGSMLTRVLKLIGKSPDDYWIDNVLRCAPPDLNIARFPQATATCRYRDAAWAEVRPQVVVAMGATALKAALGYAPNAKGVTVQDFHGTVTRDPHDRFWVVGGYHPSHLQRGATNLMGVSAFDISVAHRVVQQGGWPADPGQITIDPPVAWAEAWAAQYIAAASQDPYAYPLAVDIETPEKGTDEGALVGTVEDATYTIKRVNFSAHPDEGITLPYEGPYRAIVDRVLAIPAVKYFWYKGYDEPRLRAAGHLWHPLWSYDLMWAAKALQSDLPGGLGFWAPFYSTWGAWKHLNEVQPGKYAAIDGLQTRRVGDGIFADLETQGRSHVFTEHMHRFHAIVLQPATDVGLPVDKAKLEAFKGELDEQAARLLTTIADAVPETLCPLAPPAGLTKPPAPGEVYTKARTTTKAGKAKKDPPDPMKAALYARARVIEKLVWREVQVCKTCEAVGVAKTHRCKRADLPKDSRPVLVKETATVRRWFWQEPFNPDSPQQLMAYARAKGHQPGKAKQTGEDSMDKETLSRLIRETADPVYEGVLAYRAVAKVRGTYVIATLRKMDSEDRLHGTFGFKPSTMRLNGVNPNLQNVVAGRGEDTLASGFRKCIVARGRMVPAGSEWADE